VASEGAARGNLYLALVHWPVYNREGDTVATSVTPLDLHDLGRIALTYGVAGYYVTNPYESQRLLIDEIIYHWREGVGGEHSPHRKQALATAKMVPTVEDAFDDVVAREAAEPFVAATTARRLEGALPALALWEAAAGRPVFILFGTGYGLTEDVILAADAVLEPIIGRGDFNHLPVRAAVAIYLDRLCGDETKRD
jgi:hypothetical protein